MDMMEKDIVFLRKNGLMDYSLLLAIENTQGSPLMNMMAAAKKKSDNDDSYFEDQKSVFIKDYNVNASMGISNSQANSQEDLMEEKNDQYEEAKIDNRRRSTKKHSYFREITISDIRKMSNASLA